MPDAAFDLLSAVGLFLLIRSFIEVVAIFGLWSSAFPLSSLDFSCARPRGGGGQPIALASVPILVIQRVRDLGPLQEHPSSPCPTGTATQTKGLGRSPPHGRGRELSTLGHVAGRYGNESKTMINSNNPNTPPRGSTLLSLLRRKKEKKEQIRCGSPHTGPQGRPELPPELRRTPSRASPGRDGVRTRCHLPSRYDGEEADRGHR